MTEKSVNFTEKSVQIKNVALIRFRITRVQGRVITLYVWTSTGCESLAYIATIFLLQFFNSYIGYKSLIYQGIHLSTPITKKHPLFVNNSHENHRLNVDYI